MRVMRRTRTVLLIGLIGLVVVGATACSRGDSSSLPTPKPGFCEAASRYDREVEKKASLSEQITILEKLERNAPKDVAADATFFLETMREFQAGDPATRKEIREDPRRQEQIKEAVDNVNRRAADGCGFYESEPGDGS
jgi:hypothetical protein